MRFRIARLERPSSACFSVVGIAPGSSGRVTADFEREDDLR